MVTIANAEMAEMWDGEADEWISNADRYDATDRWINQRFQAETVVEARDRVLDIGCGTGKSSRDAARRATSGSVLGVDLSVRMLDDARRRSREEGLHNVEFLHADATGPPVRARLVRRGDQRLRCHVLRGPAGGVHQHPT